jgi:hypothetical protein
MANHAPESSAGIGNCAIHHRRAVDDTRWGAALSRTRPPTGGCGPVPWMALARLIPGIILVVGGFFLMFRAGRKSLSEEQVPWSID